MDFFYTHTRKNDALGVIKEFLKMTKTRYDQTVRFFRTDDERTLGLEFAEFMKMRGITTERSAPYTPAQNGQTERSGGVLVIRARALRIAANLPASMWPEIFKTVGYLNNRTPKKMLGWKTPIDKLTGEKPKLSHLQPYGCRAFPLNQVIPRKEKLEPRAFIGYLVGYDSTNIFRIWIPSRMKVIRTRDVMFDKTRFYEPNELDIGHLLNITVENVIQVLEVPETSFAGVMIEQDDEEVGPRLDQTTNQPSETETSEKTMFPHTDMENNPHLPTPEKTPERDGLEKTLQSDVQISSEPDVQGMPGVQSTEDGPSQPRQSARPRRTPRVVETTDESIARNTRSRKQAYAIALASVSKLTPFHAAFSVGLERPQVGTLKKFHRDEIPVEPRYWRQMLHHRFSQEFQLAAIKELTELEKRGTYELVEKVQGQDRIPLTWVFKYKHDTDGYVEKFKARLCVRGDLQMTQQDTYAATLAARTFRALMAISAAFDLDIYQYDAVSAFINSPIDEEIFCECPEGFDKPGYCWKLRKALYGLKQAPILWYKLLTMALEELGLAPVPGVNCLFANEWIILFFYVDDIVVICRKHNSDKLQEFEKALLKRFEMHALGELKWFLGIRITRDRANKKIWLCQDSYITKMAAKFNQHGETAKTPLTVVPTANENEQKADSQRIYAYQQRVGSLNFAAVISRPDIAFATAKLAQFLQNPCPDHLSAADRVIAYLNGTKNLAIEYNGHQKTDILMCASDAAFADDELTRRSSDGYLFQLYGGPIDWRAAKQATVTTSSTEAELLALSRTAKEAMWWKRFFQAIRFNPMEKLHIRCDNRQTLRILDKEMLKLDTKLRHVDIHRHWLRQEVQAGRINVSWMPTAEMPADGFTKVLPRQKHDDFIKQLHLTDISVILANQGQEAASA